MLPPSKAPPLTIWSYVTATVAYLAVFRLAVLSYGSGDRVAPVWLATGLSIWLVIKWGPRMLLVVALGELLGNSVNFLTDFNATTACTALTQGAGNVATAWCGAWLWRLGSIYWKPLGGFCEPLTGLATSLVAPLASAFIGVGALVGISGTPLEKAPGLFLTWWASDMIGSVFVLPVLFSAAELGRQSRASAWRDLQRCLLLLAALAALAWGAVGPTHSQTALFLCYPLVLLATLWFAAPGARLMALLLGVMGTVAALTKVGPFFAGGHHEALFRIHWFYFSVAAVALALPVIHAQSNLLRRGPLVLLLGGWLLSGGVFFQQQRQNVQAAAANFVAQTTQTTRAIEQRLDLYVDGLLRAQSFVVAAPTVSRADWSRFIGGLDLPHRYPGMSSIGLIYPVKPEETAAFLRSVRADQAPDFDIHPVPGKSYVEGKSHFVLTHMGPLNTNRASLGLDLGSEPARRAAFEAARDTGQPQMTKRIGLQSDTHTRSGVLLCLPIYRLGAAVTTVAERRAAHLAWVDVPFRADQFLTGVLASQPGSLHYYLFESGPLDAAHLLHSSAPAGAGLPEFAHTIRRQLLGHDVTLAFTHGPAFISAGSSTQLWLPVSLVMATVLLTGWILSLQTLRESEEHYRTLVERSPEPVTLHRDGNIIYANPAALQAVGAASLADVEHRPFLDLVHADSHRFIKAPSLHSTELSANHAPTEMKFLRLDGTSLDVESQNTTVFLDGLPAIHVAWRDITARKQAEAERAVDAYLLELVARGGPLRDLLTAVLRTFEAMLPGQQGSVLLLDADGQHLRHGAAPSLPPAYCHAIDGVKIGPAVGSCGTAAYTGQTTAVADIAHDPLWADYKDLALAHGLQACWSVPIKGVTGRVLGTFAFYHPTPRAPRAAELATLERGAHLTGLAIERAQAETALRESEFRWKFALEGAGDGLWDWNIPEKSVLYTARWKQIFGFTETELTTNIEEWRNRVHPDDLARVMADVDAHLNGQTPVYHNEHRGRHKDGSWRWVLTRGLVVACDASGQPLRMIGTTADITARKQTETEHRDFERKMLDMQKLESLGVLAGGIAHDFNNILTGILGQVSLGRVALPAGAAVHGNLDSIQERSLRAADLCKQMLAYSGQGQFVVQKHSLNRLVEETTHLLNLSISKKAGLHFNLNAVPPVIRADATQIRQVIMNLVINASEAIGDAGGAITVNTGLTLLSGDQLSTKIAGLTLTPGPYAYLEVTDTGSGMTPANQAKIFDPFFTTKATGRGLGLAAVLGIIRGHQGDIRIQSTVGQGTTFKVLLPCLPDELEDTGNLSSAAPTKPTHTGCILVVDDEEFVREPLAAFLKMRGYEVVTASTGQKAVDAYRAEPDRFTLVLMDLSMPQLDGTQAFAQMRSIRATVQVVLMSGFDPREVSRRFKDGRPAGFIQKPFLLDDVVKTIGDVLGRPAPA